MFLFAILRLLTAFFIYEVSLSQHKPKQAKMSVYKAEQIDNFLCFLDKLKTKKIAPNKKPPIIGGLP
jgi:hypothetical protein